MVVVIIAIGILPEDLLQRFDIRQNRTVLGVVTPSRGVDAAAITHRQQFFYGHFFLDQCQQSLQYIYSFAWLIKNCSL